MARQKNDFSLNVYAYVNACLFRDNFAKSHENFIQRAGASRMRGISVKAYGEKDINRHAKACHT